MTEPMPGSPVSGAAASAITMHEVFTSYIEAGFTRMEALAIVIGTIQAAIGMSGGGGGA